MIAKQLAGNAWWAHGYTVFHFRFGVAGSWCGAFGKRIQKRLALSLGISAVWTVLRLLQV